MESVEAAVILILGFILLIIGGEALVRAAVSSALRFKVRPGVIGLTVIAAGTSAPEGFTSVAAALKGAHDIALGNAVGSNIFNILVVIGLASIVQPNKIENQTARIEWPFLLFASILLYGLGWDLAIERFEGLLMLVLLTSFLLYVLVQAKKRGLKDFADPEEIKSLGSVGKELIYFVIGFAGLIFGADLALNGAVKIGELAGLSERVIGVTIVSVGTGLPELVTSMVAAYRGRNDIAVANVIGSNILNSLGVVGLASVAHPLQVSAAIARVDSIWMLGATLILFPLIWAKTPMISKRAGWSLFLIYPVFIVYLMYWK